MKRIRICEESEARLMIRDGSFSEFVKLWSKSFKQEGVREVILRMRNVFGYYGLKEAVDASELFGIGETILLEVGNNMVLRKRFNALSLFQKVGNIWVRKDYELDSICSGEAFFNQPEKVLPFYEENDILKAKDLTDFAYSLKRKRILNDCSWPLLKFGDHEIWRFNWEGRIKIYSHFPLETSMIDDIRNVVNHIQSYQKTYKKTFGPM